MHSHLPNPKTHSTSLILFTQTKKRLITCPVFILHILFTSNLQMVVFSQMLLVCYTAYLDNFYTVRYFFFLRSTYSTAVIFHILMMLEFILFHSFHFLTCSGDLIVRIFKYCMCFVLIYILFSLCIH